MFAVNGSAPVTVFLHAVPGNEEKKTQNWKAKEPSSLPGLSHLAN